MLASRTLSKCDAIAELANNKIKTAQVDADNVPELVELMKEFQPNIVLNVALPYQDLTIMTPASSVVHTTWTQPITNPLILPS